MRWKSDLLLFTTALVWGSGFIAQRLAAGEIGAFLFNGGRFIIGALILLPFIIRMHFKRKEMLWMAAAGLVLVSAAALQQIGINYTTATNAGFITGMYILFVPLILFFFFRQHIHWLVWLATGIAAVGGLLLSALGNAHFMIGDLYELAGAVLWALHVILINKTVGKTHPLKFAFGQFLVCGLVNLLLGLWVDQSTLGNLGSAWGAILYSGIFSVGVGFTLQVFGQRHAPATDAALILSLEAVFAAVFGYLFLQEMLTPVQFAGCFLIMSAVILVQFIPAESVEMSAAVEERVI
jgi:drug/metabolite transporter (DMT)-like permease